MWVVGGVGVGGVLPNGRMAVVKKEGERESRKREERER